MSKLDAKTAIWITKFPRPEHQKTVEWLNQITPPDTSIFLVKVEGFKIGDSAPAPLFTQVAGPDVQAKAVGREKRQTTEKNFLEIEFWWNLLPKANTRSSLFTNVSAENKRYFLSVGAGISGIAFQYLIYDNSAVVQFRIRRLNQKQSYDMLDKLGTYRTEIESKIAFPLFWKKVPNKRTAKVGVCFSNVGLSTPDLWPGIQDKMVEAMCQLENAIRPYIKILSP